MLFDLGWSELLVIAVVLVVVVGPKDLPGMLRTFGRVMRQMRGMAGDFRRQFDDALKEAELDDVRKGIDDMRSLDPRNSIRDAMNPMKAIGDEIRSSLNSATASTAPRVPTRDDPPLPEGEPLKAGAADAGDPDASDVKSAEARPVPAANTSATNGAGDHGPAEQASVLHDTPSELPKGTASAGEPAPDAGRENADKAKDVA